MSAVVVAIIGLIGTLGAATLPKWLEHRASTGTHTVLPSRLATVLTMGIFAIVGAVGAANSSGDSDRTACAFFLGLAGIGSALYGAASFTRNHIFGAYVGYISATVSGLFLIWSLLVRRSTEAALTWYAVAMALAVLYSLWLLWRPFIMAAVNESRASRERERES